MAAESGDKTHKKKERTPEAAMDDDGGGILPELLRRGLTLGFTGLFMTEEAVRRALGDSVPRDMLDYVLEQSERTRAEFLDRISKEFGRTLSALDPVEVAKRLLEGRTIEVTAQFRLVPKKDSKGLKASRAKDEEEQ
jgi:hypothetical protein